MPAHPPDPAAGSRRSGGYSAEDRPIRGYAAIAGTFAAAVGATRVLVRLSGREAPERLAAGDLLMMGATTYKLSRLIAKGKVTSFLRAPFTEFERPIGQGEVEEKPRGSGLRLAVGELMVCPYCLMQWVSVGLLGGMVLAPRATRLVTATCTVATMGDLLQRVHLTAKERS